MVVVVPLPQTQTTTTNSHILLRTKTDHIMPLLEELSLWKCLDCSALNDETNPTRCHNCNKKKPKLSTVKRILKKRAKEAMQLKEETKEKIIALIDNIPPKQENTLEFDLSKLQVENS